MASWHVPTAGDPLASITACADSCATLLTSISAIPDPVEWHGTSRHVWDEERTRFLLWVHDLKMVHSELTEAEPAYAQRIAKTSISANLGDLKIDLQEVCAAVSGLRSPLEQQDDHEASTCFDSSEDSVDFQEMTERLSVVRATIDGLLRTLTLQYSYCLSVQEVWRTLPPRAELYSSQEHRHPGHMALPSFTMGPGAQQPSLSSSIAHVSPSKAPSRDTSSKQQSVVPPIYSTLDNHQSSSGGRKARVTTTYLDPDQIPEANEAFNLSGQVQRQKTVIGTAGEQESIAYAKSGQQTRRATNPADQNPPCNTLSIGNLPSDTSEDELKSMFSKARGFKRLCFRTKANGPMCFVEFEDLSFATNALNDYYGHPLHNSVKGGITLSFSKNPLGVRSAQPNRIASSMVDDEFAGRAEEDNNLGSGRVLTFLDNPFSEAASGFDPDKPSSQHIQGLSDSTI